MSWSAANAARRNPNRADWPCGHPRTQENTWGIGDDQVRCKACRQVINRRYYLRRRGA